MRYFTGKFLIAIIAIAILPISTILINNFYPTFGGSTTNTVEQPEIDKLESVITTNTTETANSTMATNSTFIASSPIPKPTSPPTHSSGSSASTSYSTSTTVTYPAPIIEPTPIPTPPPPPYSLNESFLLGAIKSLKGGGQIVLESNLGILGQDVLLPSNITLSGANPQVTIYLLGKRLQVAPNSTNVTIKDLTIDATDSTNRALFVGQGAKNIVIENVVFKNYVGIPGCLVTYGEYVELNSLTFTNVINGYPIRVFGSNVNVRNSYSSDNSKLPLIFVGGVSNVSIIGNSALNRPLLAANNAPTPTMNLWIENNTNYFPNATYALLILGGYDSVSVSNENVTVKGNFFSAAVGAWNAISVYGLTKNSLIVGNTVDMSLSGHNGIAISSGINVTVVGNVVYGARERSEGGIEVESNPVHNRYIGFSENVTITGNTVYNSTWGIYVRVMAPEHPNWNGTVLLSKNILIENNVVFGCEVGVNLLQGEKIVVKNNNILSNTTPLKVDTAKVYQYTVTENLGYP